MRNARSMGLTLRFWGTRGSVPAPGADTVRYGGNTPCAEVRTGDGALLILDAGTGIRELGRALVARAGDEAIAGDIFLSHAHWDHIQGIPFFAPIFRAGDRFTIWSTADLASQVERAVREQMSPTVFPVPFDEIEATVTFRALEDAHVGAGYALRAMPVRHPGGALGYRVAPAHAPGRALVYISDNELGTAAGYDTPVGWRESLVDFARGASVLVHDAMYTAEEYDLHRGWGHSCYSDVVELAIEAEVERLVLFHHSPERSDEELDRLVAECRALASRRGARMAVGAAAEGMTIECG